MDEADNRDDQIDSAKRKRQRGLSPYYRTGPAIAALFVAAVLLSLVINPADPMSIYIDTTLAFALAVGAFWLGLRIGRTL